MSGGLYGVDGIGFPGVHDERTGTHMADSFAPIFGNAGVILAGQNGPGATHLVTGLHRQGPMCILATTLLG